jgi:hypothetical protein
VARRFLGGLRDELQEVMRMNKRRGGRDLATSFGRFRERFSPNPPWIYIQLAALSSISRCTRPERYVDAVNFVLLLLGWKFCIERLL